MNLIQMTMLAIGLSMDSLAIALTSGALIRRHETMNVLKIGGMLAFIQMTLIAIGWYMGSHFASYLEQYDHWIAFSILVVLGGRVIYETAWGDDDGKVFNPLNIFVMFTLAVAASIDAAAVGLSLSFLNESIFVAAILVGLVTLVLSCLGVVCGCKVGCKCNKHVNFIGGIVLILIGCAILYEHTIVATYQYPFFNW